MMIITAAIPKGGVGKTTMLRALASVALKKGYTVTLVDGDRRQNMSRWVQMLEANGNRPENLNLVSAAYQSGDVVQINTDTIVAAAEEYNGDHNVVFVDTQGDTNEALMAGLYVADIVLIPIFYALDDVTAAIQITDHYIPISEEGRGQKLPALFIETKQTIIDAKARKLAELKAIISENGTPIAPHAFQNRVVYRDLQSGQTLYSDDEPDKKAIAESEALFGDVLEAFANAMAVAA